MKIKKMLAVLSALCLCMAYAPVTEQALPETVQISANAEEFAASGICGENLTWELDEEGTLTISGTGKMTDWTVMHFLAVPT